MVTRDEAPNLESLLHHSEWLARLARRLVADEAAADDVVQDTWVAALRNPPAPGHSIRGWMTTVARRFALAHRANRAREARQLPLREAQDAPSADEVVARIEEERRLADLVLGLEEPYQKLVLQRYYRGLSAAQIARSEGVPPATVRTRLRRALGLLRERLDREHGGDGRSWLAAIAPIFGDPNTLGAVGKGALAMSTKTIAISVASGALCALVVTEGVVPMFSASEGLRSGEGARIALESPQASMTDHVETDGSATASAAAPAADSNQRTRIQPEETTAFSTDELREWLLSSRRIDQVRAIELLLQEGTEEANGMLLNAFLSTDDPILVSLLEEALLEAPFDFAPILQSVFERSTDPGELERMSLILAKVARDRPELRSEVVGLFLAALQGSDRDPERAGVASGALLQLGAAALDDLGYYVAEAQADPQGLGSAVWVMSQLGPEHGDAVLEKYSGGLDTLFEALSDSGLTGEERDLLFKKTGSLGWAAGMRPPEEHDRLGDVLLQNLLRTSDAEQAGSLAWGISNLTGIQGSTRVHMTESIFTALESQTEADLTNQYVRMVSLLVKDQPLDANFYAILQAAQEAQVLFAGNEALEGQLDWLLAELRKHEAQQNG